MDHEIGYMQVQMRLYFNDELYETFAINAFDECFCVKTDLISSEHKVIDDPDNKGKKLVQVIIKVFETEYTISMLIPVHQSENWELVQIGNDYIMAFYCILGTLGQNQTGE